jgi:hypothetical protein
MGAAVQWTAEQDATIRQMRDARASWDSIAVVIGRSRWCVIEHGRRINAALGEPAEVVFTRDENRNPLPPGHPITWGAIASAPYPYPVF